MQDAQVEARAGQDASGLPDGTYLFKVDLACNSGEDIALIIQCPVGYPQACPSIQVERGGQVVSFESAILRQWDGRHYLVEIAREVRNWYA